jgi:ADP-ribosylation factor related protein 1
MGILSRLLGRKKLKSAKIVLLGASGAGKTTFIKFLESGKAVEDPVMTTLGIDVRKKPVNLDGWALSTIDIGGQELYQKTFWNLGLNQADAVVYVIDGTIRPVNDSDAFEISLFSFEYMLQLLPPIKPILILINKQDLVELNPLSAIEATQTYPIQHLIGRSVNVLPSSAKYGNGVDIALNWLVNKLEE